MRLPLALSVPHAGWNVPPEAKPYCILAPEDIVADGDEGAGEIYDLAEHVAAFNTSDIARAIVDLNREESDRTPDGVVKTETCWQVPVYDPFPPEEVIGELLDKYYRPYHRILTEWAGRPELRLGVDCHTMAAHAPPIGPDPGMERPLVCLGDNDGTTAPAEWMEQLTDCFAAAFETEVAVNDPFSGGYITQCHGQEMPWVQVELSRTAALSKAAKRSGVLTALTQFCHRVFGTPDVTE